LPEKKKKVETFHSTIYSCYIFSYEWFCSLLVLWPSYSYLKWHKWHTQVRNN